LSVQADLSKLVGKLHDELQQKKAIKVELQNCIQKLKVIYFVDDFKNKFEECSSFVAWYFM